ncbi:MAG: hypothetical protein WAK85_00695, partial [Xanthobacteraceae bacterium]
FRRVNEAQPSMHHDALELPGGKILLVTYLREGQRVTVLQLPATERPFHTDSEAPATETHSSVRV